MVSVERSIAIHAPNPTEMDVMDGPETASAGLVPQERELGHLITTFSTTLVVFAIFFCQGILIARILGPVGRGEFGTAVFVPRDILLYVGLLGGIEIVSRFAAMPDVDRTKLKYAAASLGLFSGIVTALFAAILSIAMLLIVDSGQKAYLLPYCLLVCLFIPWEHIHLTVSGVDRGKKDYSRYNLNRLIFAAIFPISLLLLVIPGVVDLIGGRILLTVCVLFVISRIVGLVPTLRGLKVREWIASLRRSESEESAQQPRAKHLLREGWPYALSMLATELFERLDIVLILILASVEQSGFYFVAVPAAALLTIAPNSLSVFTFNAGANERKISLAKAISVIGVTAIFQIVSLVILFLIIPKLIVFFYGEPFQPAIQFVWYLLPAFAIKGFLQALDGYLKGCGKPLIGVWARIVSIFVMLAAVALLYPQFQLISIPMAACVGQSVSMAIVTTFVLREVANRQDGRADEGGGN